MRFLRPDLASYALLVPLVVTLWALRHAFRTRLRRREAVAARFRPLSRRSAPARDRLLLAAALITAGAMAFAAVRPQARLTHRLPDYERQDLIILLDRSASMAAHDIRPSRSARATLEIRNFLRQKPEGIDRVALVGFADASVVLSFLTQDVDSVLFYFDWIDSDPTPQFGTNIGAALKSAMDVAKKDDRPTRKLFLIVSDGEDHGAELDQALDAARAEGYRLNCIGVGSEETVPIPVRTADGRETPLRDESGRTVTTKFSETTLQNIALTTGGRYLRSTSGNDLGRQIASIVAGERRVRGWHSLTEFVDLYPAALRTAFVAGAAVLVLF